MAVGAPALAAVTHDDIAQGAAHFELHAAAKAGADRPNHLGRLLAHCILSI
jgi:hypothetical protein